MNKPTSPTGAAFGRESELRRLSELVGTRRLVTLLGPAGIGKTCVARAYVEVHAEVVAPEGGAWFCDLSTAQGRDDAVAAIAGTLAVPLLSGDASTPTHEQLGAAIRGRGEMLLVLDNCEQVVAELSELVATILEAAPQLTVVATSRALLGVRDEVRLELGPLAEADAVTLLESRGRLVRPELDLSQDERGAAGDLVRLLDGNPLAIELAAARLAVLGVHELIERMDRRFELLKSGHRHVEPRHASLHAAIESSWAMLHAVEQRAMQQAAVFVGGFSLKSAEAVLDLGPDSPSILDVIQSLRDRSFLRIVDPGSSSPRFSMYESIRDFCLEGLPADERRRVERRHAEHFVSLGERLQASLHTDDARQGLDRIAHEEGNLDATRRRMARVAPALSARAALVSCALLAARGPWDSRLRRLDEALLWLGPSEASGDPELEALRVRVLVARAEARRVCARVPDAYDDAQKAVAIARRLGSDALLAAGLEISGLVDATRARYPEGLAHLEEAEGAAKRSGDRSREGTILSYRASILIGQDRLEEAREVSERALAIHREVGNRSAEVISLCHLGAIEGENLQVEASRGHLERALDIARRTDNRRWEAAVLNNLATLSLETEHYDLAQTTLETALRLNRDVGNRRQEGVASSYLGVALQLGGRLVESVRVLREAAAISREVGATPVEIRATAHLGASLVMLGRPAAGLEVLDRARALAQDFPGSTGEVISEILRQLVDPEADASRAAGRNQDERFALRCVELWRRKGHAWSGPVSSPPSAPPSMPPVSEVLTVGSNALWFRPPGQRKVDLSRRRALPKLLEALCRRRAEAPEQTLTVAELVEAGWPGEKIPYAAATNRLYVAIATLRKLGLGDLLVTRDDGYLLDPNVGLERRE